MVVDERFEIGGMGEYSFDLGDNVDIVAGAEKEYAFSRNLKTMSPSVIVTDEISKENDINQICQTVRSGVSVIATAHAENLYDLKQNRFLSNLISQKIFERIVVLSKRNGIGTVELVADENLKGIYLPYLL